MKFLTYCSYQYFRRFFSTGIVKIEHLEGICSLGCISITKAILPFRVVEEDWGSNQKFSDQLYLELTLQKTKYICLHLCMCMYTYTHKLMAFNFFRQMDFYMCFLFIFSYCCTSVCCLLL